jgi:hypothetical protein
MRQSPRICREALAQHPAAKLEGASRADAEERAHPDAKIEGADMHEQPLQHVLVSGYLHAPENDSQPRR